MLPQVHQHLLSALDRTVRADTVFVFGAVVLDVLSIGVNSALAGGKSNVSVLIFWLLMLGVVVVTFVAAAALRNGTKECLAYHEALMAMYSRENVAEFVPSAALTRGITRYHLFFALVLTLGGLAIAVPLVVKFVA